MITQILIKTLINEISALNDRSEVTLVEWIELVTLTHTGGDSRTQTILLSKPEHKHTITPNHSVNNNIIIKLYYTRFH